MEPILAHLQDHAVTYGLLAACIIPILIMTRRYSGPVILWSIELVIYSAIMHVFVHYFVQFLHWFRMSTIPHYEDAVDPNWNTPLARFWDRTLYEPEWIFFAEVIAIILMVWAMIHFRPIRIQRFPARRKQEPKKSAASRYRPGAPGSPR